MPLAFSGLAALGAEVVWTRLLSLLLGGTVYTFSIILAVFLCGLWLGSSAGAFISRRVAHPVLALTVCQSLLILSIGWTAYALAFSLPYWPVDPWLSLSPLFNFQLDLVRCVWAILPATLLWGASFPLALAAAAEPGEDPARLSGEIYAANTAGSIVGALAFSLFLIPGLGTRGAQQILLAISAAGAVAAGIAAMRIPKIRRNAVAVVVPAIVCSTAIIFSVEMYRGKSLPMGGVSLPRCAPPTYIRTPLRPTCCSEGKESIRPLSLPTGQDCGSST